MRHRVSKVKFRGGRDSTRMMTRKLLMNFLNKGKLTSTEKRIKVLRSKTEVIVNKAKRNSQSDKNYIQSRLNDKKTLGVVINQIAPNFTDRSSGYVRIVKLPHRATDGAKLARLEWIKPVVLEEEKKSTQPKVVKKESSSAKTVKSTKVSKKAVKVAKK